MNHGTSIEFKAISYQDIDDLAQECTAYMKTKQFMARRITQQQEEIEQLKKQLFYHSSKHLEMYELFKSLNDQLELIKDVTTFKNTKTPKNELNLSSDELTNSYVIDEKDNMLSGYENLNKNGNIENTILLEVKKENLDLKKENEKIKIELLEKSMDFNKVITEKFILFNELNELVNSIKKTDLNKLNSFYKKNINTTTLSKFDMPISRGIKYNVLSAQSQIAKILRSDLISKKLARINDNIESNYDIFEKNQIDNYSNMLKKIDEDFDNLIEKKLTQRGKSFCY